MSEATKFDLMIVQSEVAHHMEQIEKAFKPGVRLTVLVRTPGFPEGDFVMTSDGLEDAIEMLQRRLTTPPTEE